MAKSFKSLVAKTGNKKTAAIAKKRTKELLKEYKKYFIVLKCEYETVQSDGWVARSTWFQFLEEWNPDIEDFKYCIGEDNYKELMNARRRCRYTAGTFYFDSKKEAIKAVKILRVYGIAEKVDFAKDPTEKIKKVTYTYYVCSTTSDRKEKVI